MNDSTRIVNFNQLLQKYKLDNINKNTKAIQTQKDTIVKVENEQQAIIRSLILSMEGLESQSDMSLWFFSGIPTLENEPSMYWEEEYENHIGDLYFDRDTGYVYQFKLNGSVYEWERNQNEDLIQAMALTNASIDTTDNQRRVFFETPKPPYTNGDWYIKTEGLYICQISKEEPETYAERDFIIASKYVVGTQASEMNNKLNIVSGQVTTIERDVDSINEKIEDNRYYVDENGAKHLISSEVFDLTKSVDGIDIKLSQQGGPNLFINPVGLFGNYGWTGVCKEYTDTEIKNNTFGKSALFLQNGTRSQIVQVPNGTYTVSFLYKKLISLANCTIDINGYVITLDSLGWSKKTYTFEVKSNKIEIKMISDTNDSCYVSDTMLNKGLIAQAYSSNATEVVTNNVKIGDGIEISSNASNIKQKVDNDGNRIINTNTNQIVSEFTDKGMTTDEMIAKKGQIAGEIIARHGNQVWHSVV